MADKSKKNSALIKRKRKLEAELTALQAGHPSYTHKKRLLEKEIHLIKAEIRPRSNKRSGRSLSARTAATSAGKKSPLPGGASFPSFQLPSPKSPTFYEDSIKSMGQLRNFCKQCVTYMQRADTMFDALHGMGSNLHSAGVLPKLMKGNVKGLTTGEWASILMAFLNSPLSGALLGGGGGEGASAEQKAADGEAK
ncbi:hypothetical protein CIG75_01415 [Tumebacillus algifaecis]|uniref:Uncharacterized protein n=1 Tax=Tumebacillus algifaecis TaxID=1214604 RepID=A0A223CWW9_9BACL|nr:hypothetical protein [Tumebacillus algifaecis]ASS73761.1 hypothetical protein CIG75_01415 [Tumebacillus algifaecis]